MTELVVVSAANVGALASEVDRLVKFLDRVPDVCLRDVAYTTSLAHGPAVLAVIADSVSSLRARLYSAHGRLVSPTMRRIRDKSGTYFFREPLLSANGGKLAFVYPGVMGFYPDMFRDLAIAYPECRSAFDELEEALVGDSHFTPSSFIFPPAPYYRHDADIFKSGAYAQALVSTYAGCVAMTRILREVGVRPDCVVGFAGGDLAAMMSSGAAGERPRRPDRVQVIREIYDIVHKAVNHGGLETVAMISVVLRHPGEADQLIAAIPEDKAELVVDFSPRQKTYAVAPDYEAEFLAAFAAAGIRAVKLALDRPFNTPRCASLVPAIRKFALNWMKFEPVHDVYSCATAAKLPTGLKTARDDVASRWARPVRFAETIRRMHDDGSRVFVEVGPRSMMTAAIADTLKGLDHAAIAVNSIHRSGRLQLLHAVGQLAALGAPVDLSAVLRRRGAKKLDFDSAISLEVRRDSEMKLSRSFPRLTLLGDHHSLSMAMAVPSGRGKRAAQRAAALANENRRQRQFDLGAMHPLVSGAETVASSPSVFIEVVKKLELKEMPFLADFALGSSQLSYSDPNLKGLVPLELAVMAEIMAEVASMLVPNRVVLRLEDLATRRMVAFANGELSLNIRAERIASSKPEEVAVKMVVRSAGKATDYTWPEIGAVVVLGAERPPPIPVKVEPLVRPRSVHWTHRDIYPARLNAGSSLRGVQFVDSWSESGLDYEIETPRRAGCVMITRFPIWIVNPLLLHVATSGFKLWRSHERFSGAYSVPFRVRRIELLGDLPEEGAKLKSYMRLTGVSPTSQVSDITVSDGNGKVQLSISGWEELTERVPVEYRELILQPATCFLTRPLGDELLGNPATDIASAYITDIPYAVFERNDNFWLRVISEVVLDPRERKEFQEMSGSAARRTEWLFGRIAVKEAVRRYLRDYYQARWSDADVSIWRNDKGKPFALGAWKDYLATHLDVALAHTSQFVVAIAAANARAGVDVETVARDLSDEFANSVFTHDERDLAATIAGSAHAIIKFWCAKEAVSKALGVGIRYSPQGLAIKSFDPDSGKIIIRLEGQWEEVFKDLRGRDILVTTRTVRDHALATCFIPATLIHED